MKENEQQLDFGILKITVGLLTVQEPNTHTGTRTSAHLAASLTFAFARIALISAPSVTLNSLSPSVD